MMNREKVWHAVRAAADILETRRLVIVGSTVVLLTHRNYSARLALSREVDLFPEDPALHAEMDYALEEIGLQSAFDVTHGFYVDGVEPALIKMPADWQTRARTLTSDLAPGVEVILPDLNDIEIGRLVAWRGKDIDWLEEALRTGLRSEERRGGMKWVSTCRYRW